MTPESGVKILRSFAHENSGYDKRLMAWTQSVVQKMSPSERSKVGYLGLKIDFFSIFFSFSAKMTPKSGFKILRNV